MFLEAIVRSIPNAPYRHPARRQSRCSTRSYTPCAPRPGSAVVAAGRPLGIRRCGRGARRAPSGSHAQSKPRCRRTARGPCPSCRAAAPRRAASCPARRGGRSLCIIPVLDSASMSSRPSASLRNFSSLLVSIFRMWLGSRPKQDSGMISL